MNTSNEHADDLKSKALFLYIGKLFLFFTAAFLAGHFAARLQEHFTQGGVQETVSGNHVIESSEGNW
ncbi:MAG: delta-lactam-biosynthetic de-N-acetylase, partial [Schaedlerella arabinosiphila]|nr:delta-lactam-biosynthetic de-N-acetylase [Schaedlerella arabinosiphila]